MPKYVLDAHALVWYLEANPRLGQNAKAIIDDPSSELVLPVIALAEAAWVVEHGRSAIPDTQTLLSRVQADSRLTIAALTLETLRHSLSLQRIPELHDRLIVATALLMRSAEQDVTLLTKDAVITSAGVVLCAW